MGRWVHQVRWRSLKAAAMLGLFSISLKAQEFVLVTCENQGPCLYRRVSSITVQGKGMVRILAAQGSTNARLLAKARATRLASISGLYRDPQSGSMRIYSRDGQGGDIVLPPKLSKTNDLTASSAWDGVSVEYREQLRSKVGVAVPLSHFVAFISGASSEAAAIDFVRIQVGARQTHPRQKDLIAGALEFAARSDELRRWRDELRTRMRESLDLFRGEKVDPARLEATLEQGLAALRVYRLVAAHGEEEAALQDELTSTHRKLVQRFAIASVLQKSALHDQYLEKMDQIGLARWSRPLLVNGIEPSLKASAESHYKRATEIFNAKQYARAFDEAQVASKNAPCDPTISDYYYKVRVEFVNRNAIPAMPDYEKENRSILQQIVRELDEKSTLTPERIEYIHKRIAEGERLDKDYLPLQLKSAEFLANLGALNAAREVVTRLERNVQFGQKEAEEWLHLDASLNGRLETTRHYAEKQVAEGFANGQFREAFQAAETGLRAEPSNAKLLYYSALASAITRDDQRTKQLVKEYLKLASPSCIDQSDATNTLFELYRRGDSAAKITVVGKIPHWMSGELYQAGEVFYDPFSGGFLPRVLTSSAEKGTSTEFVWEGFMAKSISTTTHTVVGKMKTKETTLFEAEPTYDQQHVCITGIGPKANSAGERSVTPIRYRNSPQFDPAMAAKFTGKVLTRGWAGNPFFHPFLWTGIFIFDLTYDEQGRIREAIPVTPDASRPRSPFSERLKFNWDGSSKRLLSISGATYRREMEYDHQGRIKREKITYPKGKGSIDYAYYGNTAQLRLAKCQDNFFDKTQRIVTFRPMDQ